MASKAKQEQAALDFMQGQAGNYTDVRENYQLLQWYNGAPLPGNVKAYGKDHLIVTGGFAFKAEQDEEFPLGDKVEYTYKGGFSQEVFALGAVRMAVIGRRIDWFFGNKNDKPKFLPRYEEGAQGRNRFLVLVEGLEDWHEANGPLMISVYGVNGLLMSKADQAFMEVVHKAAEKLAEKRLDAYTFYRDIIPDKHQASSKEYADNKITPPTLRGLFGLAEGDRGGAQAALRKGGVLETTGPDGKVVKLDRANPGPFLNASFIGARMMAVAAKLWPAAQEWAQQNAAGKAEDFSQDLLLEPGQYTPPTDEDGSGIEID